MLHIAHQEGPVDMRASHRHVRGQFGEIRHTSYPPLLRTAERHVQVLEVGSMCMDSFGESRHTSYPPLLQTA